MTEEEYKYNCEKCEYHTNINANFSKHKRTKKHRRNYEEEIKNEEIENKKKKYHCTFCDYYTNSQPSFSKHKKSKKHKKNKEKEEKNFNYKCEKCPYMTNCNMEYFNHIAENHINKEKLNSYQNIQQNNSNNKIINNNVYNIHINGDKETYKLMLNEMTNNKFIELLGGNINNQFEFHNNEMWDEQKVSDRLIDNIVNKSLENKKENKSIKDIKLNKSDLRYDTIGIKDKKYDLTNYIGDTLKNSIVSTKEEHFERLKDIDYIYSIAFINKYGEKYYSDNGRKYDYNTLLNDIFCYSEDVIDSIVKKFKMPKEEREAFEFKAKICDIVIKQINNMKQKLKREVDMEN
jgi:hypothetical protein